MHVVDATSVWIAEDIPRSIHCGKLVRGGLLLARAHLIRVMEEGELTVPLLDLGRGGGRVDAQRGVVVGWRLRHRHCTWLRGNAPQTEPKWPNLSFSLSTKLPMCTEPPIVHQETPVVKHAVKWSTAKDMMQSAARSRCGCGAPPARAATKAAASVIAYVVRTYVSV